MLVLRRHRSLWACLAALLAVVVCPLPSNAACVGCNQSVGCPAGTCCICCGFLHSEVVCCPPGTYSKCVVDLGRAKCTCAPLP